MAIAELPRFDTVAEAIDCSIENGVSVLNTGVSPQEIQLAYQGFSNCGFNTLGPTTSEVAGIIMPTLAEIVEVLEQRRMPIPNSYNIMNYDLGIGLPAHADFQHAESDVILRGLSILIPIYHGSFFQQYSSMQGRRTNAGDYFPGQLLFLRQELDGIEPTVHSSIIRENPSDKSASRERILLSADYKVSTKN